MTMPSKVLAAYLISEGLFTDPEDAGVWPLFSDDLLPDDDAVAENAAALYNPPGVLDGKDMRGTETERYGLQLRARATEEATAWDKLKAVVGKVVSVSRATVTVGDESWMIDNITRTTGIIPLMVDEKQRSHLVVNFLMRMHEV